MQRLILTLINIIIYAAHRKSVLAYYREIGHWPNVAAPRSYNEKMFWRRIFDHNPRFVTYTDKLLCRRVFAEQAPDIELPRILWTGHSPAEMPFWYFEAAVVVKTNHGCDFNWFTVKRMADDRRVFNYNFWRWLSIDYGRRRAQWAYSMVDRKMFVEALLADAAQGEIVDLKVHLFHGEVFFVYVYEYEKTAHSRSAIFAENGQRLAVTNTLVAKDPARALPEDYVLPDCYGQAIRAAKKIAADADYLRVDFMVARGRLYGGEITVYPTAGLLTNSDKESMNEMGRRWDIRKSWFLTNPQPGWRGRYARILQSHLATAGA